ncbi:hypothetical protein [Natranaerobius trueperi]|uniref:Uncharacterized protein n=1 Tax=Natranaerobius trueperi TaxID=759412 RepID=A0A226BUI1_9FIRM|nr:hypothetical protein [Natranaerobius trueperi]OWZ82688.1 hypothetical protein CDO51_12735 [Natranaerobius trueperi]
MISQFQLTKISIMLGLILVISITYNVYQYQDRHIDKAAASFSQILTQGRVISDNINGIIKQLESEDPSVEDIRVSWSEISKSTDIMQGSTYLLSYNHSREVSSEQLELLTRTLQKLHRIVKYYVEISIEKTDEEMVSYEPSEIEDLNLMVEIYGRDGILREKIDANLGTNEVEIEDNIIEVLESVYSDFNNLPYHN